VRLCEVLIGCAAAALALARQEPLRRVVLLPLQVGRQGEVIDASLSAAAHQNVVVCIRKVQPELIRKPFSELEAVDEAVPVAVCAGAHVAQVQAPLPKLVVELLPHTGLAAGERGAAVAARSGTSPTTTAAAAAAAAAV
jgi:hypothetical protein